MTDRRGDHAVGYAWCIEMISVKGHTALISGHTWRAAPFSGSEDYERWLDRVVRETGKQLPFSPHKRIVHSLTKIS